MTSCHLDRGTLVQVEWFLVKNPSFHIRYAEDNFFFFLSYIHYKNAFAEPFLCFVVKGKKEYEPNTIVHTVLGRVHRVLFSVLYFMRFVERVFFGIFKLEFYFMLDVRKLNGKPVCHVSSLSFFPLCSFVENCDFVVGYS